MMRRERCAEEYEDYCCDGSAKEQRRQEDAEGVEGLGKRRR